MPTKSRVSRETKQAKTTILRANTMKAHGIRTYSPSYVQKKFNAEMKKLAPYEASAIRAKVASGVYTKQDALVFAQIIEKQNKARFQYDASIVAGKVDEVQDPLVIEAIKQRHALEEAGHPELINAQLSYIQSNRTNEPVMNVMRFGKSLAGVRTGKGLQGLAKHLVKQSLNPETYSAEWARDLKRRFIGSLKENIELSTGQAELLAKRLSKYNYKQFSKLFYKGSSSFGSVADTLSFRDVYYNEATDENEVDELFDKLVEIMDEFDEQNNIHKR